MKIFEKIIIVLVVISLVMEITLMPGGTFMLLLTLTLLSIFYYVFGFAIFKNIRFRHIFKKSSYKGYSAIQIIGAILTGFSISIICLGIAFIFNHYPGGNTMLLTGLFCFTVILIISVFKHRKSKSNFYHQIIIRLIAYGVFGLVLYITPFNKIIEYQFRNYPDYIEAYKASYLDPENDSLKDNMIYEYKKATMSEEEFEIWLDLWRYEDSVYLYK